MTTSRIAHRPVGFALVAVGAMMLAGCAGGGGADEDRIVIGVDDGAEPHWGLIADQLAEDGIELEVRNINDGVQLNQGTADGELDINLFQHLIFLSEFNVEAGSDLVPVGATAVYPLALYSQDYASVEEIPDGSVVAVPNNPTNLARALLNLQTAGLLELEGGGDALSSPEDIASARVEVLPVDTNQTVTALRDGSAQAAVVNNTQAQHGGLGDELILFKEDLDDPALAPYINAFVTRAELKDDARWEALLAAYHSEEVQASVSKSNQGNLQFKQDWTQGDLEGELNALEGLLEER